MKWQHSNRTVRLALSLSIVSASSGLLPILTSAGEPPPPAISLAHQRSRFAVIDPLYSATVLNPAHDLKPDAAPWLYGEAELECWRLQVLRERMKAAKLNVGYPGVFHQAQPKVSFRCAIPGDQPLPARLTLRAVGDVAVKCGDRPIYQSATKETAHFIELPKNTSADVSSLRVDLETKSEPPSILIEQGPLAFRYARITGAEATEVEGRALFHPARYRGAFACSDKRLTRIWMHSAYTHRVCQFDFVLDGIKRDRLPWVDNMVLSAAVESYAFGDPGLLRRTLTVMGRTSDSSDINGIVDYNILWVIGHDAMQQYFPDPDKKVAPSRHAQVLSMVSGLTRPEQYPGILKVLKGDQAEPLNSPSMFYYVILALSQLGNPAAARDRLQEVWGAMLAQGASTFWEGYSPREKGAAAYGFYERPFGKSLCHAWGAGPVVLLPQLILGLRPTAAGWRRFTVEPNLGDLEWACATVPTLQGNIEVEGEGGRIKLSVPPGTTALYEGKTYTGPAEIKGELK